MKETFRRLASRVLVGSGTTALGRRLFPKNGTLILYGHRVQADDEGFLQGLDPRWFEEQLRYLAQHYHPISLSELVDCFEKGVQPPADSFVVTFDDGFRDNLINALPILEELEIPATIFLVTGCIADGRLPWPQHLGFIIQNTQAPEVGPAGGQDAALPLVTGKQRAAAFSGLLRVLQTSGREAREAFLGRLENELKVDCPRNRMLSWDDAGMMRAGGLIEFGAHTFSHPWMEFLSDSEAQLELERSKEDLKENLDIEQPFFCFPGGSRNHRLVEMVKELGFRGMFQSRPNLRVNSPGTTDQFSLSRIGLPNAPACILEAELDGLFHPIRRLYRRGR